MKKSNNYSKFVATAATATLVATAVVPAASAQEMKFTDVGDRYADAVNYLVENNITQGLTETKFGTQSNIKRVDVAVLIAKATLTEDEITNAPASTFGDVPARATKYVSALKAKGIINGKTATSFGSDLSITRGEAAIMLSKAYEIEGDTANVKFGDVGTRYKDAVAALVDNEITTGKTDSSFGTALSITRGELAIFLHRLETLDATPAPEPEYKVDSVEAISGTQVQVKFTDAVNPASLFKDGKMGEFKKDVFTMSTVGNSESAGTVSGMLSKDGKTLTVTTGNVVEGKYTVILDQLKTIDDKAIEKFEKIVSFAKDEKAPTVVSANQVNASQYSVVFSEPLSDLGAVRYTDKNGVVYSGTIQNSFEKGDTEVLFTLPGDLEAGKTLNVQFADAKDMAGNTIASNTSTTFTKGEKDGVAPTVKSIVQTGAKEFTVEFSEMVAKKPEITLTNGYTAEVEKDASNPMKYIVTTNKVLDGSVTVSIKNFKDMSGEEGTDLSKLITFKKDTVAPAVTASNIVTDENGEKEYLELTFDKNVNVVTNSTIKAIGEYTRTDAVTKELNNTVSVVATPDTTNKVRVELSKLLGADDSEGAKYNLALTLSNVTSDYGVNASTSNVKFTRGKDLTAENTDIVNVTNVEQDAADHTKVNVTFDKKVDGNSAVDVSNYKIDGVSVKSVKLGAVKEGEQTAVLTLDPSSIKESGNRYVTIQNIKADGSSKTMEAWSESKYFVENEAPTVTAATMSVNGEINLTFSEDVAGGTEKDFEVLVGGKTFAASVDATILGQSNEATISLGKKFTTEQIEKGITLKPLSTIDITDISNNKLSVPANITVTQ